LDILEFQKTSIHGILRATLNHNASEDYFSTQT
jgi:hypothetical protein